jgi:GPH family glycoside/pentoside/hexuronide:cation symporter
MTNISQQKIVHESRPSSRTKWGYGFGEVGGGGSWVAINTFLLFFLIEIVGLRPGLAGIVLLVGRIVDAITDPIMGMISDRTHSRWGRRKPYIWAGAIPLGISFAFIWMLPGGSQSTIFLLAVFVLLLHTLIYTMTHMPYLALVPELTSDYNERTTLISYRMGVNIITSLIIVASTPLLVDALNRWQGLPEKAQFGWMGMGVIFGAMMSLGYLVVAALVKEPPHSYRDPNKLSISNVWQEYRTALSAYGFPHILALFTVLSLGVSIVSAILPFFLVSNLRLEPGEQTIVLGTLYGTTFLFLPFWNWVSARIGKKLAFAIGLAIFATAVTLIAFFAPVGAITPFLLAIVIFAGVGITTCFVFPWAMLPDVVVFDILKSGKRREGLFHSIFTFAQKSVAALGIFLNAQMLAFVGYQAGVIEQTARALAGIRWMIGPVMALLLLVTAVIVLLYPITKERYDIAKKELAMRSTSQGRTGVNP